MSTVAFRCDGDARRGAGHVARCLQIAAAFRASGDEVLFVGSYSGTAALLLDEADMPITAPDPGGLAGVPDQAAMAIVDSYDIDEAAVSSLASRIPVAAILDAGREPRGAVGVQYHPGSEGALAGCDYAPVDPRYAAVRRPRAFERVLVTVGGGQAGTLLRTETLAAVEGLGLQADAPAAAAGLVDAVGAADVAVSAAGVTAYELACAGIPTALVPVASNQVRVAAALADQGVALSGAPPAALLERFADERLRAAIAAAGPALIDGYGSRRVRDALRAAFAGRPLPRVLRYRPATATDSAIQLRWRNEPATRAASRNGEEVTVAEHQRWYADAIVDPQRALLVVLDAGRPVGSLRFDTDGTVAEISVMVASERRSAGLGSQAVREAWEPWLAANPGLAAVRAVIRETNSASIRAFERAGFVPVGREGPEGLTFMLDRAHLASLPT